MTAVGEPIGGLTDAEAARRLAKYGPNVVVPARRAQGVVGWATRALSDPMTLLLLVAGPTYLALGDTTSALVCFAAIVPLAATGFVLETRAEHALDELAHLTAPTALVARDGQWHTLPIEVIVPGDLMLLHEGDVIAADGHLVADAQLGVDESSLTGESYPVDKHLGTDTSVFSGTTVVSGRASVMVDATGPATAYGHVGSLLARASSSPTPLQRKVRALALRLGVMAAGFVVAVTGVELLHGSGWGAALLAGVSLAIAILPEELPLVYTLYLALGARRLAGEHALFRRLAGVETLGSTTVICTDKTGTLTLGRIAVAAIVTADGRRVDGAQPDQRAAEAILETAVLASEPQPFDPLDQAIVAAARTYELDVDALHGRTLAHDYAFDPVAKYMSHVWRDVGGFRVVAKGAVEGILDRVSVPPAMRAAVEATNQRLADDGMRVIALAQGHLSKTLDRAYDEEVLELVGLLGFEDPLRPGVAEAIEQCGQAGIRIVMVTGDHPLTAHAIAEGLGLPHRDELITTGAELDAADDTTLDRLTRDRSIFARTRPEQKHLLVEALRARGEIVAMTGDGINDAPALREADIGIAMGQRGTQVARESSTMVLLDDNFATIVTAIREGRRIFDNLRRAFEYLVAFHVPLVAAAVLIPITGQPLLLLPVHLILLQIIVHPTAALAFEGDPPDTEVMRRPPRPPRTSLIDRAALTASLTVGATLAAAVLAVYLGAIAGGVTVATARSVAFGTMLIGDTILVLVVRARTQPFPRRASPRNRMLAPVLAATVAITLAALLFPPLRDLLQLSPPDGTLLVLGLVGATLATIWPTVLRIAQHRHATRAQHGDG